MSWFQIIQIVLAIATEAVKHANPAKPKPGLGAAEVNEAAEITKLADKLQGAVDQLRAKAKEAK